MWTSTLGANNAIRSNSLSHHGCVLWSSPSKLESGARAGHPPQTPVMRSRHFNLNHKANSPLGSPNSVLDYSCSRGHVVLGAELINNDYKLSFTCNWNSCLLTVCSVVQLIFATSIAK